MTAQEPQRRTIIVAMTAAAAEAFESVYALVVRGTPEEIDALVKRIPAEGAARGMQVQARSVPCVEVDAADAAHEILDPF